MQGKMIDICCTCQEWCPMSLSYWSIVMMSLVEFSTGVVEFCTKLVLKVLLNGITNQEKVNDF